jgi:hypothetical protein
MKSEVLAFWRGYATAFDGFYTIPVDEVEEQYVPRGSAPSEVIATQLMLARDPSTRKFLVCGARGSGKTTELVRLASRLRTDFVPIRVDVAQLLSPRFGTLGLIATLAAAAEHALRRWQDPRGEAPAPSAAWEGIRRALTLVGVTTAHLEPLVSAAGSLLQITPSTQAAGLALAATGPALRSASTLLSSIKSVTEGPLAGPTPAEHLDAAAGVVDALNVSLDMLLREGAPALLLIEGFDKARRPEFIDLAFENLDLLCAISAPVVFSGPVTMLYSPRFGGRGYQPMESLVLPNVPVVHPPLNPDAEAQADEDGIHRLKEIFLRRARRLGLPDSAVDGAALALAARMSSGLPRQMFQLLDRARLQAFGSDRLCVTADDVVGAVTARRHELQYVAAADEVFGILSRVLHTGQRPDSPRGADLLYEGYIAAYPNGHTWFRPNEILVDWLRQGT